MRIPRWAQIVVAALGLFAAGVSHAATLTVRMQGAVTVVPNALTGVFSPGNAFSLVFSVQTDATDTELSTGFGFYDLDSLSLTIGPNVYSSNAGDPRQLLVINLLSGDEYDVRGALSGSSLQAGYVADFVNVVLRASDTLFDNEAIPAFVPGIGEFSEAGWTVEFAPSGGATQANPNVFLGGSITSITAVPVPAAAWLLGSAMLGLAGIARRRRAVVFFSPQSHEPVWVATPAFLFSLLAGTPTSPTMHRSTSTPRSFHALASDGQD